MMGESEIFGVYLNAELVTSLIALILSFAVHRLIVWRGWYRHVWHRPLFEIALFVILWSLVVTLAPHLFS